MCDVRGDLDAVPATTSQMYDAFVYDNAGAPTLELLAWTNDNDARNRPRETGRHLVKSGATTRRYRLVPDDDSRGQTEDSLVKRYVWNYYNANAGSCIGSGLLGHGRTPRRRFDSANANTANQVECVIGFRK